MSEKPTEIEDEPTEIEIDAIKQQIEKYAEGPGIIFPRGGVIEKAFNDNKIEPERTEAVFKHLIEKEELTLAQPSTHLKRKY